MTQELVNTTSGEVLTLADYLAAARGIEQEIGKLDHAIAATKEELKDMKVGREKAVRELRAIVREIKVLGRTAAKRRGRRRGK